MKMANSSDGSSSGSGCQEFQVQDLLLDTALCTLLFHPYFLVSPVRPLD